MISGLIPVLETPFTASGALDLDGFQVVIDRQLEAGVDGLMFPGFASEFSKLSDAERDELEAALLARTRETRVLGIASVPDHGTRNAVLRVERAIGRGADAINVLPPYFLAPSGPEVLAHVSAVLEAAGAVPVIVQLAPALTGSAISARDLDRLAGEHDNLVAVKVESVPPGPVVTALGQLPHALPGLVGYAGLHLIDALRRGASGVQPGCSFPELYRRILDAWHEGDPVHAEALHSRLVPFLSYWMQSVELVIQVEKTISHRRGWISSDYCRKPGRPLDEFERATIDRFMTLLESPLGE